MNVASTAAQPLASALEAYSAATGVEIFYDAVLAAGHRSASGGIDLLAPGGQVTMGFNPNVTQPLNQGIMTLETGDINISPTRA